MEYNHTSPLGDGSVRGAVGSVSGKLKTAAKTFLLLMAFTAAACGGSSNSADVVKDPICGDGIVTEPEECDNGSQQNSLEPNAACRPDCKLRRCGDGVKDDGEACDKGEEILAETGAYIDGNSNNAAASCRPGCILAGCGDGIRGKGEECDLGAENSDEPNAACRTNCKNARCGDAVLDSSETCDEGDKNSNLPGGTCRSDCKPARCGDGVVDPNLNEACDLGLNNSNEPGSDCRLDCTIPGCGDGVVSGTEDCDKGEQNSNTVPLACRVSCKFPSCGDGVVDNGSAFGKTFSEVCDNGMLNSNQPGTPGTTCRSNCMASRCGDGIVDTGEQCDTGTLANTAGLDGSLGCSSTCRAVSGWVCTKNGGPGSCHRVVCGDGNKDNEERCDEGPEVLSEDDGSWVSGNSDRPGASCRSNCTTKRCGDGILDDGEECDTGNLTTSSLDGSKGCDASCHVVSGWTCEEGKAGAGSCRKMICGDGYLDEAVGEVCDKGSANSDAKGHYGDESSNTTCRTNCTPARCGDGVVDRNEACDTGSLDRALDEGLEESSGCTSDCLILEGWACVPNSIGGSDCHPIACGDGIKDSGEACDNGSENTNGPGVAGSTCRTPQGEFGGCVYAVCGDGIVDQGEECDNGFLGNTEGLSAENGCTSKCKIASGWTCRMNEENENFCYQIECGDGYADGSEECDNGEGNSNLPGTKGQTCRAPSDGFSGCKYARCGDGIVDNGEACDVGSLGSTAALDGSKGCTANCNIVSGWACVTDDEGVNRCHKITCGDEFRDVGEACDDGDSNSNEPGAECRKNCTPRRCGDGVLDDGEACDTGLIDNLSALDGSKGCDASCRVVSGWTCEEGIGGANSCHKIQCGDTHIDGDEECDDGKANNSDSNGIPGVTCRTNCMFARCGDGVLDEGEACDTGKLSNPSSILPSESSGCTESCEVVEGWSCSGAGPGSCHKSACGNGILEEGEACDKGSGNSIAPNAECRPNCTLARCGDGIVDSGEGCDIGSLDNDELFDGTSGCTRRCAVVSGWACRTDSEGVNSCHEIICGDGFVDGSEECDSGENGNSNEAGAACRSNCRKARCGDGIVDPGESCDTGSLNNQNPLDGTSGCNSTCKIVDGWACTMDDEGRNVCHQIQCGDGYKDGNEQCDEGEENNSNAPGATCRKNCTKARCGDGILDENESCDTGRIENTGSLNGSEGCNSACNIIAGWACVDGMAGPGSCHQIACGDGYTDGTEECDFGTQGSEILNPNYIDRPLNVDEPGLPGVSCRTNCTWARCGDGIMDSGETCDTGSGINSTVLPDTASGCGTDCSILDGWACTNNGTECHPIVCGDGFVDGNEKCDDGNVSNEPDADCRLNCTERRCGDGIIDVSDGEECDTGDVDNFEELSAESGCRKNCKVAPGWACLVDDDGVNVCHEITCGDGFKDGTEECDDGEGNNDGKGIVGTTCRPNCTLARCGDGILDDGESCDTGSINSTEPLDGSLGCNEDCSVRDGWACYLSEAGPESCHKIGCGDGVVDLGEECDEGSENKNTEDASCRTNCTFARCGDGIVSSDEECDTGSLDNMDELDGSQGCSASCKVVAGWACITGDKGVGGSGNCHRITCGDGYADGEEECDFGNEGADILNPLYRDSPKNSDERGKPEQTCRTNCTWARCGDGVLDVGESCDTASGIDNTEPLLPSSGCDDSCGVADGYACLAGQSGPGSCHPISCGDGFKDGEESCDEGEGNNSDEPGAACRRNCTLARCGDGIVDAEEECDTGNVDSLEVLDGSNGCSSSCRVVSNWSCLDGQGGEGSCHLITCGDGYKDGNEDCDMGSEDVEILNSEYFGHPQNSDSPNAFCRLNCTEQRCGDGIVDDGLGEECDTGSLNNTEGLDGSSGCASDCTILEGWTCTTEDGVNTCHEIVCGDGIRDEGEECDDGENNSNTVADACRTNCKRPFCGDNVIDSGELCDDGINAPRYMASEHADIPIDPENAYCNACTARGPYCGDGHVDSDYETCDRGSNNSVEPNAECRPNCTESRCGDGILDRGEQCDTGTLTTDSLDGSQGCDANCRIVEGWECDEGMSGPFSCHTFGCGDGRLNPGEECDDGPENLSASGSWISGNSNHAAANCRPDCRLPSCGDGIVVTADGETCDDGDNSSRYTSYGQTPLCFNCTGYGPRCGDGVVSNGEVCDDGVNTPRNGASASQRYCKYCTGWGSYCGDGVVSDGEVCDRGSANSNAPNASCRTDCTQRRCGDGVLDNSYGEYCDDGVNNGTYGHCRPDCTALARGCGDGVVEAAETCDEGILNGLPGHCSKDCSSTAAPYCGDGAVNSGESCDTGTANGYGPAATCRSDCTRVSCGDGIQDPSEECDLGTARNTGSLCTSSCRRGSLTPTCGDGIQDPGETCDRGNQNGNTGTATCTTSCGYRWRNASQDIYFNDRLDSRSPTWNRSCTAQLSGSYRYHVYAITNATGSNQTIDILSNQNCDGYLHVFRGSFSNGSTCVASNDDYTNTRHSRLTDLSFASGETIYVVASVWNSSTTSCNAAVRITKTGCGNGIRSNGESCDDGNTVDGDGCDSFCHESSATCTNSCNNGTCTETCATRICGNGRKDTGEACDDGNRTNGDGCSSDCAIESGYSCVSASYSYRDNSSSLSWSGSYCHGVSCGNGFLESSESCDDGNTVNNDGCDRNCTITANAHCSSTSTYVSTSLSSYLTMSYSRNGSFCDLCGNGRTAMGEQCDDGNTNINDGCNASCNVESNKVCSVTSPSHCDTSTTSDGVYVNSSSGTAYSLGSGSGLRWTSGSQSLAGAYNATTTSPYFYARNGCTASSTSCSAYPYKAMLIRNNSGSSGTYIFEAVFASLDGYMEIYSAPFNPNTRSGRLASNDDGSSSTCYTTYTGVRHSCISLTLSAGQEVVVVASPLSARTTGGGNVTVSVYKR